MVDFFVAWVHGVGECVVVGVVGGHDGFCPGLLGDGCCIESGGGGCGVCGGHGVEGSHAFGGCEYGEVVIGESGFFFEECDMGAGGGHVGFVVCAPVFFEVCVLPVAVLPFCALLCFCDGGVGVCEELTECGAVQTALLRYGCEDGVEGLCFGVVGKGVGECEGVVGGGIVGD